MFAWNKRKTTSDSWSKSHLEAKKVFCWTQSKVLWTYWRGSGMARGVKQSTLASVQWVARCRDLRYNQEYRNMTLDRGNNIRYDKYIRRKRKVLYVCKDGWHIYLQMRRNHLLDRLLFKWMQKEQWRVFLCIFLVNKLRARLNIDIEKMNI